jgi:hypothetical protein
MNAQAPGAGRQGAAADKAAFARILSAMAGSSAPASVATHAGLIRAFRDEGKLNIAAGPGGKLASADSEVGPTTPHAADAAAAAAAELLPPAAAAAFAAAAASPDPTGSGSFIAFKPSDPILLDAHRMLALAPCVAPAMQRAQWSSFDYHVLEKLYTGYASKGAPVLAARRGRWRGRAVHGACVGAREGGGGSSDGGGSGGGSRRGLQPPLPRGVNSAPKTAAPCARPQHCGSRNRHTHTHTHRAPPPRHLTPQCTRRCASVATRSWC